MWRSVRCWPNLSQAPAQDTTGQMEIHATLNGPLKEPAQIQAHAEIPSIRLQTKSIDLASAKPIKLDYRGGLLQVDSAELKGNGTDIRVSGSLPVQGAGDMNLAANGTLDLGLLQDWTGGGHSSGQVNVELTAKGKKSEPAIQGRVRIANAVYTSDSLPVGIESLNGDISIDGNQPTNRQPIGHRGRRHGFGERLRHLRKQNEFQFGAWW